MIMLIGLVTKNGILIVEFANKKQLTGLKKIPAVMDAAVARFRPILMTSLAMSLGALPLALSLGDASTSRIPLGIVVVGGIMFSLILTLFVIPAMYSFLSSKKKKNALEELDEAAAA
jgi:multidrug efflux pump